MDPRELAKFNIAVEAQRRFGTMYAFTWVGDRPTTIDTTAPYTPQNRATTDAAFLWMSEQLVAYDAAQATMGAGGGGAGDTASGTGIGCEWATCRVAAVG